jgi:type III secretion system FlhB-like substrate exporter
VEILAGGTPNLNATGKGSMGSKIFFKTQKEEVGVIKEK